jgi:hypothetical protein
MKLSDVLRLGSDSLKTPFGNNALLYILWPVSPFGLDLVFCRTIQGLPVHFIDLPGLHLELHAGVKAEDEPHCVSIPTVQMFTLAEVGISTQRDFSEACSPAESNRLVKLLSGPFMRRTVPASVGKKQWLLRVGQRNDKGVISPVALVGDVHALLAFPGSRGQGSVTVDERLIEELRWLSLPDFQPRFIDDSHQSVDVVFLEPTAKISSSRWIRNPLSAEGIEESFVISAQFDVLQTRAPGQNIEGNV